MSDLNLNNILSSIDIAADWVGLREVKETSTYRAIRDGNPQVNRRDTNHGVMVEVLSHGQFGYFGCRNLSNKSIQQGAEKALIQVQAAAKNSLFTFTDSVRPVIKGSFASPYLKAV